MFTCRARYLLATVGELTCGTNATLRCSAATVGYALRHGNALVHTPTTVLRRQCYASSPVFDEPAFRGRAPSNHVAAVPRRRMPIPTPRALAPKGGWVIDECCSWKPGQRGVAGVRFALDTRTVHLPDNNVTHHVRTKCTRYFFALRSNTTLPAKSVSSQDISLSCAVGTL